MESRGLTTGEINMLKPIFGNSINYNALTIRSNDLMVNGAAMSVAGNIFFDSSDYKLDFSNRSNTTAGDRVWFVHELTHAWQSQHGYKVYQMILKKQQQILPI